MKITKTQTHYLGVWNIRCSFYQSERYFAVVDDFGNLQRIEDAALVHSCRDWRWQ